MAKPDDTASMALFCDFENVALGVRDAKYEKFDIRRVLERLLLKGSIVVKKAYCDWERYREFKAAMHQASFELIEIPHVRMSGKNSADIRMVVDALDLCYTKSHVDTFVIISGDSDFSPLVSKLRENARTVIGVGVKNSTSELLINNCDEFIFYDDLVRASEAPARAATAGRAASAAPAPERPARRRRGARKSDEDALAVSPAQPSGAEAPAGPVALGSEPGLPTGVVPAEPGPSSGAEGAEPFDLAAEARRQQALDLVVGTLEALSAERGEDEKIWGSMVKQTLRRRKPGFSEGYYGFRSFNRLLEEARDRGLIELSLDDKSGGYTVRSLG